MYTPLNPLSERGGPASSLLSTRNELLWDGICQPTIDRCLVALAPITRVLVLVFLDLCFNELVYQIRSSKHCYRSNQYQE